MKSLKGISSFVAVASSGSFAAAAKLQGVSAVAVSKNVATLERQLAVRLFQRTTRKLSLTPEGNTFYKQCLGPLRELEAAQAVIEKSSKALSGLVRVTCAAPFATGYVLPIVQQFHAKNPRVQIELHMDDSVTDMVAQGYDVGIRVGRMKSSSLVARPIAPLPFVVCASPDYLRLRGEPASLEDLAEHNCLRLSRIGSREPMPWFLKGLDAKLDTEIRGNLTLNDFSALQTAAMQGAGLACIPLPLAMPSIRQGRLLPLLQKHISTELVVYLYYLNRKNLPMRTRSFVDYVLAALEKEKDLQTSPAQLLAPYISTGKNL
ncbi:LysR family transcriptional regulator [Variovorax sp. PCZ-1]|uniref:LysR family transcriptional regulator n=1 Tax=Variovorax sp. PCZ-1 TaxID=2835533 RepID=UPI001BCC8C75|nr:LysR family transcriptional regulator [Variovorax sp. PCZ-1]MBS7806787.1 LysR family transcriptional regulator [Variovorax sp. PCZ-1]